LRERLGAIEDYRYLLNRGYKRESALRFVGDKYQLGRLERLLLYRCVHSAEEARARRRKRVPLRGARGQRVAVDGYNTLITVESALEAKPLIACDDGFIRDLSAVHNRYRPRGVTEEALCNIIVALRGVGVGEAGFFFDGQISRSGEVAALAERLLAEAEVKGVASAVRQADKSTVEYADIVVSSDAVVIDRARYSVDLAREVIRRKKLYGLVLNLRQSELLQRLAQIR
jgi:hypothetical protein